MNVQASTVSVVDPQSFKLVSQVKVGRMPYGVAIDEQAGRVLVTNQQSGSVTMFDAKDGRVVSTIAVGQFPEGVVVCARFRQSLRRELVFRSGVGDQRCRRQRVRPRKMWCWPAHAGCAAQLIELR